MSFGRVSRVHLLTPPVNVAPRDLRDCISRALVHKEFDGLASMRDLCTLHRVALGTVELDRWEIRRAEYLYNRHARRNFV